MVLHAAISHARRAQLSLAKQTVPSTANTQSHESEPPGPHLLQYDPSLKLCWHAGLRGDVHSEWDEVKQHDVLFLLTIRPPDAAALAAMAASGAAPRPDLLHGLTYVRGCEVMEVQALPLGT